MARSDSPLLVALGSLAIWCVAVPAALPAGAQLLERLHVRAMTMQVDPVRVRVGETVRLRIAIRVDERIGRLSDVTLPDLSGFVALGDERRCVPDGAGTLCAETVSLAPTLAGLRTIAPVTLDAIDARNGRPSRFGSNAVQLVVLPAVRSQFGGVAAALGAFVRLAGFVALLAAFGAAFWWLRRRRMVAAPAAPSDPSPVSSEDDARWPALLENLRARPSRARVLAIRSMLRERLGARNTETFGDLVGRGVGADAPAALEALRLVERAAFVDDAGLARATFDALPALERLSAPRRVGPAPAD